MEAFDGRAVPIDERRSSRERRGVHLQAIVLGELGERREVPRPNRGPGGRKIRRLLGHPRRVIRRRRRRARHAAARADLLLALRGHGDHDLERPIGTREQRLGEAVAAVGRSARMHLDETAEDRTRRGAGPLPSDDAALARRQREPERRFRRAHERCEARCRRRKPRPGRKIVAARDARAGVDACLAPQQIEAGGDLREILVAAHPVQRELVARDARRELDRRLREQRVERDRDRADGRHVQARVGLAPIFDEREIGAGARSRDVAAFLLRSSHSP